MYLIAAGGSQRDHFVWVERQVTWRVKIPFFLCERTQSRKPSLKEKVTDDCCYNRHLRVGF